MPVRCWKVDDMWHCRWGTTGKIYKSKFKDMAYRKAELQGKAIRASQSKDV